VLEEGAALLNLVPGQAMPRHPWYRAGLEYGKSEEQVHVGGLIVNLAIGYSGFAAGPTKHFIDEIGLSDPLIARLPIPVNGSFRPGHFFREMPEGYVASVAQNANLIADPDLRQYYEPLRLMTRGPLWSFERIKTIVAFQLGWYNHHLEAYAVRRGLRRRQ
jgi:arabinofuranosyltransferase